MNILVYVNRKKLRGITEIAVRFEGIVYGCLVTDKPLEGAVTISSRIVDVCSLWGNTGYNFETFGDMATALDWLHEVLKSKVAKPGRTRVCAWDARSVVSVFGQSAELMEYLGITKVIETNPKGVHFRSMIVAVGNCDLIHLSELCLFDYTPRDAVINSYLPEYIDQPCKVKNQNDGVSLGEYSATDLYLGLAYTGMADGILHSMF